MVAGFFVGSHNKAEREETHHTSHYKSPRPFEDINKVLQGSVYVVDKNPEQIGDSPLFIVQVRSVNNQALYSVLIDEEVAKKMQVGNTVNGVTFYHYVQHNGAHQTIVTMSRDQDTAVTESADASEVR